MAIRLLEPRQHEVAIAVAESPVDEGHLLRTFLENTPDHVYFKDLEGRFVRLSRSLVKWMGVSDSDGALGLTDSDFFAPEHASAARAAEIEIMRTGREIVALEEREVWPDGRVSWVSTTKVPLRDRGGQVIGIFGLSRDISARKLSEARESRQADELAALAAELEKLTLRDELTGLYNRRGFEQLGDAAIQGARQDGSEIHVLFADVDGLKAINDRLGHAAGDRALCDLASALRGVALRGRCRADRRRRVRGGDRRAVVARGAGALPARSRCGVRLWILGSAPVDQRRDGPHARGRAPAARRAARFGRPGDVRRTPPAASPPRPIGQARLSTGTREG